MGGEIRLDRLKQGKRGRVIGFKAGRGQVAKLTALGIRPGKEISKISNAFIGGPVTIKIDNTRIAMGIEMASRIILEVDD